MDELGWMKSDLKVQMNLRIEDVICRIGVGKVVVAREEGPKHASGGAEEYKYFG